MSRNNLLFWSACIVRMSVFIIKREMSRAQELVRVHGRTMLRRGWPALPLLLFIPGAFNGGVLAHSSTLSHVSGTSMEVAYEPTVRLHEPSTLSLSVMNVFGYQGQFSIRIEKRLSDNFSVLQVSPKPLSTNVNQYETVYLFSATGDNSVAFTLMPKVVGKTAATLQYGTDPPVAFSITTLP